MKVYVASRFEYQDTVKMIVDELEAAGHQCTNTWQNEEAGADLARAAVLCCMEIAGADALLLYTVGCNETRGGLHFEHGYAYAAGKKTAIVGPPVTVFSYLPGVERFESVEQWLSSHQVMGAVA